MLEFNSCLVFGMFWIVLMPLALMIFIIITLIIFWVSRKLGFYFLATFGFCILGLNIYHWVTTKVDLSNTDISGTYVIDRSMFPGKNANWQFEHYQFEIKESRQITFYYIQDGEKIKTARGKVNRHFGYSQPRLEIVMDDSTQHAFVDSFPALYRTNWSYYYVFNTKKYGNMFWKRKRWWD